MSILLKKELYISWGILIFSHDYMCMSDIFVNYECMGAYDDDVIVLNLCC